MKTNPIDRSLDPRTQTEEQSRDAKHSAASAAKVPPSSMDAKVGVEDQEVGKHVDADVDAGSGEPKHP